MSIILDEHHHGRSLSYVLLFLCLFVFVASTICFLYFNSLKVHQLLACALFMDIVVISEATSISTPYKAQNILCSLTRKDEQRIKDRFQFPDSVKVRIPSDKERACHSYANEVCFYEANFASGLRFPVHPFIRELFSYLHLALAQLVPNSWRILISCLVVWMPANDVDVIRRDQFLHFYCLRKSKDPGYYVFKLWNRASRLIINYPLSL